MIFKRFKISFFLWKLFNLFIFFTKTLQEFNRSFEVNFILIEFSYTIFKGIIEIYKKTVDKLRKIIFYGFFGHQIYLNKLSAKFYVSNNVIFCFNCKFIFLLALENILFCFFVKWKLDFVNENIFEWVFIFFEKKFGWIFLIIFVFFMIFKYFLIKFNKIIRNTSIDCCMFGLFLNFLNDWFYEDIVNLCIWNSQIYLFIENILNIFRNNFIEILWNFNFCFTHFINRILLLFLLFRCKVSFVTLAVLLLVIVLLRLG